MKQNDIFFFSVGICVFLLLGSVGIMRLFEPYSLLWKISAIVTVLGFTGIPVTLGAMLILSEVR